MNDYVLTPFKKSPKSQSDIENITSSSNKKKRKVLVSLDDNQKEKEDIRDKFIQENFRYNAKDYRNSISDDSNEIQFINKIMKISKSYMFSKYYYIDDLDKYLEKIRKLFCVFIISNNNFALAGDMGYKTMKDEKYWSNKYGKVHLKDWLAYRTERINFLYKCFTSKGNGYTTNILDNFYISYGDLTNHKNSKNILIGPKMNIGFESNFKIFNMFDSISNLDIDLKCINDIDTDSECFLLELINNIKMFFQKCNSYILNCQEIVHNISKQYFANSKLSSEINNIKEVYWEGYDFQKSLNKIYLSNDNYLLYECGINDFISLYDKMFNTIENIIRTNANLLNADVNILSKNILNYKETKQSIIMDYHNSQFHIFLYLFRDSKRPEDYVIDFCDYDHFLKLMDCHSLGLFYKITYYSFYLRPHENLTKESFAHRMLFDVDHQCPSLSLFVNLARNHITRCFGSKIMDKTLSLEELIKDKEDKLLNHLIFKMLVRSSNAYNGLPQYDKNEYPHPFNDTYKLNTIANTLDEEPVLFYNDDESSNDYFYKK